MQCPRQAEGAKITFSEDRVHEKKLAFIGSDEWCATNRDSRFYLLLESAIIGCSSSGYKLGEGVRRLPSRS
jgi:hypothetical protein